MTATIDVQIKIPPELRKALDANLRQALSYASLGVADQIRERMMRYPKRGAGNIPNQRRWYQRGWGPKWHSDPKRRPWDSGSGKYPITYGPMWAGYNISEDLKHSWGIERKWSMPGANTGAIVGSRATYAPAVHHYKEQAWFHTVTGWKTDEDVIDELEGKGVIDRIVRMAVKKVLGK